MPTCALCGRTGDPEYFERHHLLPGSRRKTSPVIVVDWQCGDMIHRLHSHVELTQRYNTLERLLSSPAIQRWVAWARSRPLERRIAMPPQRRKRGRKGA